MESNSALKRKSYDAADLLKFIMSVFVTAMHTSLFGGVFYPITRLAVPVFFFLSSFFFFSKLKSIDEKAGFTYFFLRVKRLLQLYFFWFICLLPLTIYIGGYYEGNIADNAFRMVKNFLFASTFQGSWYLMALIIGLGMVYFLSKKLNNCFLFFIGIGFYALSLLSSNYIFLILSSEGIKEIFESAREMFGLFCRNFSVGIIYIALGKLFAERDLGKIKVSQLSFGLAFSFILLIGECILIEKSSVTVFDSDCFIMLVPTSVLICLLALKSEIKLKHGKILREMSILVYCLHMPVYMVTGKLITLSGVPDKNNIIAFSLTLILTWAFSLMILKLESYKLFGFLKYSH